MISSDWLSDVVKWDTYVFQFINQGFRTSWLDALMVAFSAKLTWIIFAAIWLLYVLVKRRWEALRQTLFLGLCIGSADYIAYTFIKPFFARPRPCKVLDHVITLDGCASWNSFPSNHATNAMAAAVIVYCLMSRRWGSALLISAFMVGLSRIYVGVHYPMDVLGGFLLGSFWAITFVVFWHGISRFMKKSMTQQ